MGASVRSAPSWNAVSAPSAPPVDSAQPRLAEGLRDVAHGGEHGGGGAPRSDAGVRRRGCGCGIGSVSWSMSFLLERVAGCLRGHARRPPPGQGRSRAAGRIAAP